MATGTGEQPEESATWRPWARPWPGALRAGIEVLALWAIAFAQPVLSVLGDSADTFLSRRADRVDVIVLALLVCFAVPAVITVIEVVVARFSSRAVGLLHLVAVAGLSLLVGFLVARRMLDWSGWPAFLVGVGVAIAVPALLARLAPARMFLQYLGAAPVLFLALFLVSSPTGDLLASGGTDLADVTVERPAPVVMLVLDEFPTKSLLGPDGEIAADLYPNFARLAAGSTWYRNNATLAPYTLAAVPAMLTGDVVKTKERAAVSGNYPRNLFTLLGGTYDIQAAEVVTRLCPADVCESPGPAPGRVTKLRSLQGTARQVWWERIDPFPANETTVGGFELDQLPVDLDAGAKLALFTDSIAAPQAGDRPPLWYLHVMLPHQPFRYLDDGTTYPAKGPAPALPFGIWQDEYAGASFRLRHLEQLRYLDSLLGDLLDHLEETGLYDDALVVVTADHGIAFEPKNPPRQPSEGNVSSIAWTPLFVKTPGQSQGVLDDEPARSVDLLPTIAATLGIDLPWEVDGQVLTPDRVEPSDEVELWSYDVFNPTDDSLRFPWQANYERVLAGGVPGEEGDPYRLYRIGPFPELVGQSVADHLDDGAAEPVDVELLNPRGGWTQGEGRVPAYVEAIIERRSGGPVDADAVALAVGGTIGAVVPLYEEPPSASRVWGLLPRSLFGDGENAVTWYAVRADGGDPVLVPLEP